MRDDLAINSSLPIAVRKIKTIPAIFFRKNIVQRC